MPPGSLLADELASGRALAGGMLGLTGSWNSPTEVGLFRGTGSNSDGEEAAAERAQVAYSQRAAGAADLGVLYNGWGTPLLGPAACRRLEVSCVVARARRLFATQWKIAPAHSFFREDCKHFRLGWSSKSWRWGGQLVRQWQQWTAGLSDLPQSSIAPLLRLGFHLVSISRSPQIRPSIMSISCIGFCRSAVPAYGVFPVQHADELQQGRHLHATASMKDAEAGFCTLSLNDAQLSSVKQSIIGNADVGGWLELSADPSRLVLCSPARPAQHVASATSFMSNEHLRAARESDSWEGGGETGRIYRRCLREKKPAFWHEDWGEPAYQLYTRLLFRLSLVITSFNRSGAASKLYGMLNFLELGIFGSSQRRFRISSGLFLFQRPSEVTEEKPLKVVEEDKPQPQRVPASDIMEDNIPFVLQDRLSPYSVADTRDDESHGSTLPSIGKVKLRSVVAGCSELTCRWPRAILVALMSDIVVATIRSFHEGFDPPSLPDSQARLRVERSATVQEEPLNASGISPREQRIFHGTRELFRSLDLESRGHEDSIDLTLVRRTPTQMRWFKEIEEGQGKRLAEAPPEVQSDKEIMLLAIRQNWRHIKYASADIRDEKDVIETALQQGAPVPRVVSSQHLSRKDIALCAVQQDGSSLRHFSEDVQEDRGLVLQAVKQYPAALEFIPSHFLSDHDVILAAVQRDGSMLEYAEDGLRQQRSIVLAAVSQEGMALEFVNPDLQADPDIVLAAIASDGSALQFASSDLRNDEVIVRKAVLKDGLALEFASSRLQADKAIVLDAVSQDARSFQYAHADLRSDRDVSRAALSRAARGYGRESDRAEDRVAMLDAVIRWMPEDEESVKMIKEQGFDPESVQ
ncbi:unnamed protein product [Symbiodinium pilosum]|uniref:DUF4116 domain-containing protein n=1 Tax=Symbiodinium pilosum TaxID=2952 RepID=A0A812PUV4_SYMPI|nr:unnamed protein product [Symbiodinium pilosum]